MSISVRVMGSKTFRRRARADVGGAALPARKTARVIGVGHENLVVRENDRRSAPSGSLAVHRLVAVDELFAQRLRVGLIEGARVDMEVEFPDLSEELERARVPELQDLSASRPLTSASCLAVATRSLVDTVDLVDLLEVVEVPGDSARVFADAVSHHHTPGRRMPPSVRARSPHASRRRLRPGTRTSASSRRMQAS